MALLQEELLSTMALIQLPRFAALGGELLWQNSEAGVGWMLQLLLKELTKSTFEMIESCLTSDRASENELDAMEKEHDVFLAKIF